MFSGELRFYSNSAAVIDYVDDTVSIHYLDLSITPILHINSYKFTNIKLSKDTERLA